MHKHPDAYATTIEPSNVTYSTTSTTPSTSFNDTYTTDTIVEFVRGVAAAPSSESGSNKSTLAILNEIESTMGVYLYPCLIEYSLISLTVFFIMWRNVGKIEKRSFLRFGDRHVFTINCARASRGLLVGGIIFLLAIFSLIPTYVLEDDATSVTHITGFVLLIVSLFTVCLSYLHTTKLFYDHDAHVDEFDQVLILITTVGDFAYSFFGIFASIFVNDTKSKLPSGFEISIGFLAIFQTFLQSGFIMDTLKRRTTTKYEHRNKPGRETITALLLMNLGKDFFKKKIFLINFFFQQYGCMIHYLQKKFD